MYRVDITPRIQRLIQNRMGNVDPSKLSVYEVLTNTTRPIEKAAGLYDGASMKPSYLQQLAQFAQGRSYIPLILLHDEKGSLPEGLVLDAEVYQNMEGGYDLHSLIALTRDDQPNSLDDRISKGIVNRVSSSTKPKDLYCSECDFHYTKDPKNMGYLNLDAKGTASRPARCPNGHTVGINGAHLKLDNPEYWSELSLVTQGAVTDARILKTSELKLAQKSDITQLAASSVTDRLILVTHDHTSDTNRLPDIGLQSEDRVQTKPAGDGTMEIKHEDYVQLVNNGAQAKVLEAKVTDLESKLSAAEQLKVELAQAKDALAKAEAEKAELTVQLGAKDTAVAELTATKTQLETQLAASKAPEGGASKAPVAGADGTGPAVQINLSGASFASHIPTIGG